MTVTRLYPRLVVSDAASAIDFYVAALGAKEIERHTEPGGRIVHAAIEVNGITVAVKDEDSTDRSPTSVGGSPVILAIDVDNADAVAGAMRAAGATVVYPVQDRDYGRGGRLADPSGHLWMITQPLEPRG